MRFPVTRHRLPQLAADALIVVAAWYIAFQLRFDPFFPVYYERFLELPVLALLVVLKLTVFALFGFYNRWWRYVSTRDMWGAFRGVTAASLVAYLTFTFFDVHVTAVPRTIWILDWLLTLALVAASRMLARTLIERPQTSSLVARGKEVIVVGAGDAAQLMVKEMLRTPALGYTPIGLIDDDPRKRNLRLHGIRVLGTSDELRHILRDRKPDELLIAIPSASGEVRQRIVDLAREERVPVKTLPGLHELISGDLDLANQIRPVEVEDVLGREPVEVDIEQIAAYLAGETVLVTGAGGSIGSELCRQIARVAPARLVLVDHAEPALFEIERELVDERGFPAALPVLADVKNRAKLRQVFETYRPSVVFHAAAYKHVPLIEANPVEAVRNNTLATRTIAEVAVEFGVERFVLISTDKAVNAKTVMGQSKAVCEWIVEAFGARPGVRTRFVAVRFGNVLGSSGSVIPIFRRQIANGGPVTVTHPEMTRYFMTIPEAVQLVVQAGAIGGQGQVFVLDMGEPVRIVELAENMIRLSGREDVAISFVGTRPGEKLHEELWNDGETVR
ncbi:MAG TPA: nucleoside-diphosphate sugar epimerase/dehydratase, partial [Gaiellaceae bacterium]|nr:nucleoside-diphosphate sugar epimerase/dehydratase [Gaiellaceae bacterium]